MPQVDLENLSEACAGGGNDQNIVCVTLAEGDPDEDQPNNDVVSDEHDSSDFPPDFPPESFWLSKDAEYDWFDRNAFYERKDSTKGNSNSTPHLNPSASSTSQRFSVSVKPKAFIIGLPNSQKTTFVDSRRRTCKTPNIRLFPQKRFGSAGKSTASVTDPGSPKAFIIGLPNSQKTTFVDSRRRTCKTPNIRLFPQKRFGSAGKSTASVTDPGSPKVSCMGRVRSKRCRKRSNSLKRREKPAEKFRTGGEKQKTGFYSKVMNMFRSKKGKKKPSRSGSRKVVEESVAAEPQRKSVSNVKPVGGEPVSEPPSLGGVKRFASGRRSGSWTAEDFNQVVSGELDRAWVPRVEVDW